MGALQHGSVDKSKQDHGFIPCSLPSSSFRWPSLSRPQFSQRKIGHPSLSCYLNMNSASLRLVSPSRLGLQLLASPSRLSVPRSDAPPLIPLVQVFVIPQAIVECGIRL